MRSAPTLSCSTCACRMAAASTCCARCGRTAIPRPAVMISGHGTIADAVEATRAGAFDFLEKPLSRDKVLLAVKNALEHSSLRAENERLRELVGGSPKMIGSSPAFQRAVEQASMAARSDARVLLIGESGTGKELLAAHIHQNSPFAAGPFVKVNCAAIPTELIESELFGHEKGAFTGATGVAPRQVRAGRQRHDFPGRGGRPARRVAGQAAARAAGRRVPPRGRRADYSRGRARDLGHQPRSERAGGAVEVPRGSVLPAQRGAHPGTGAARAAAGYQAPGGVFPGRFLRAQQLQAQEPWTTRFIHYSKAIHGPAMRASCATPSSAWRS